MVPGWCFNDVEVQNSLWFQTIITATGMLSVTHSSPQFDTQLAFWQADNCNDFNSFTELGGNDDSGPSRNAALTACAPSGPILVQLDGQGGARGIGVLDFAFRPPEPVARCRSFGVVFLQDDGYVTVTPAAVDDGSYMEW